MLAGAGSDLQNPSVGRKVRLQHAQDRFDVSTRSGRGDGAVRGSDQGVEALHAPVLDVPDQRGEGVATRRVRVDGPGVTSDNDIVVIGAGVLGLCAALELQRRGRTVTVIDPGGENASSVAAGMIAPGMEAAIDDLGLEAATLLRAGRDRWPAFAEATEVRLARRLAEWRGEGAEAIADVRGGFRHQLHRADRLLDETQVERIVGEICRLDQADRVADIGCDLAQGFYYDVPRPLAEIGATAARRA